MNCIVLIIGTQGGQFHHLSGVDCDEARILGLENPEGFFVVGHEMGFYICLFWLKFSRGSG